MVPTRADLDALEIGVAPAGMPAQRKGAPSQETRTPLY